VFNDNFDEQHDYLLDVVEGTAWDGFAGQGANEPADAMGSIERPGELCLESANSY